MLGRAYQVFVDSDYALSGHAGDFTYRLDIPSNLEYDSVVMIQGSFPKSYYLVTSSPAGRNTFTLKEILLTATVTITPGNYSMETLRVALAAAMTAASPNGWTYTVTKPNLATEVSTGKYTFAVSGNGGLQPEIIFPATSYLYWNMGFAYSSTNTFAVSSLTSTNVVNLSAITGIVVKSSIVDSAGNISNHGNSILQEILSFNTYDFSNIMFQNSAIEYSAKQVKRMETSQCKFTITDLDDNVLDFNGGSVNFSLVFFLRDTSSELSVKDIKMRWFQDLMKIGNTPEQAKTMLEQPGDQPAVEQAAPAVEQAPEAMPALEAMPAEPAPDKKEDPMDGFIVNLSPGQVLAKEEFGSAYVKFPARKPDQP